MKIVSRWDADTILWEGEAGTVLEAVYAALKGGANLRDADLGGANLRDADLGGADLRGANLRGANLRGANLRGANLGGANLRDADLRGANLRGANLRDADLGGANLRDADLGGANLRGANLRGANLGGANLRDADLGGANLRRFRDDLWAVLSGAPAEVPGLIAALKAGRVNGSTYTGDCACLIGTLANVRGCSYTALDPIEPDSGRLAEAWFMGIHEGDTPDSNQQAKLAVEWAEDWLQRMRETFAPSSVGAA